MEFANVLSTVGNNAQFVLPALALGYSVKADSTTQNSTYVAAGLIVQHILVEAAKEGIKTGHAGALLKSFSCRVTAAFFGAAAFIQLSKNEFTKDISVLRATQIAAGALALFTAATKLNTGKPRVLEVVVAAATGAFLGVAAGSKGFGRL